MVKISDVLKLQNIPQKSTNFYLDDPKSNYTSLQETFIQSSTTTQKENTELYPISGKYNKTSLENNFVIIFNFIDIEISFEER